MQYIQQHASDSISVNKGRKPSFKNKILASAVTLLFIPAFSSHAADSFDASRYILGDWGGARASLAEQGLTLRLGHFSESAYNVEGGESSELAYADQFFVGAYFDLETMIGWDGAEFKVEITNRNGELINNTADMPFLLQSQQIFGRGNVTRLTQFSLTQHLFDDTLSIKIGRIYPSADFFGMSCAFQNLSFCSGGSSNYISSSWYGDPLSAPGAQLTYRPTRNWLLKLGSYDANPQNMSTDQKLKLGTSGGRSGTTVVGELEYKADYGNGLDGDYRIGMVRSSLDKVSIVNQAGFPTNYTDGPADVEDTDVAYYVNLEQQLTRNASGGGWRMFASMIRADEDVAQVGEVLAVGAFIIGPFKDRPADRAGIAIGRNSVSSKLTDAQRFYNAQAEDTIAVQKHEYPIEINYNYVLTPAIEIMPSLQYVINPNGVDENDDAVILGLQLALNF